MDGRVGALSDFLEDLEFFERHWGKG